MALCLLCALRMWRAPPYARTPWVIATAVTGAAALSVKWTALVTPALVAIVSLTGHPFTKRRLASNHIVLAAITALALYTACFWLHFRILIYSGMGDPFMKLSFQRTLIGGKNYSPNAISDGFLHNFVFLNKQMYIANKGIKARHRWESRWWQWMINMRGLLYYNELNADNKMLNEKIYLIINPVVTAVTLASLLVFVGICVAVFIRKRDQSEKPTRSLNLQAFIARGSFFLAAYVLNLLPYLEVARCTFLYHYWPPLFYALLATANMVNGIPSRRFQVYVSAGICILVFAAFLYWSPWIYATPMSKEAHARRRLFGKHWL
ncbi:Dolichyl-phosphate-mannose--protein mannosyltransferase 1 [Gracilariopsis chorda]|uniref:Dolichyl-phosphate-mannose--protein mannosyltransferase 1 n=1 Tax=Gracilariopsis chorda TaxID=448386 RepID=A0A2V3J421_9FLOR|nr:Dolichyl-phosphate-mannose--protein mannosyltransferase 1 [Gracilariopsis chorda]|eukprot:PXF48737.1 Dolichyl-phosphate-mannose--protein mannosyltransferase 1 [Gracilariopsis chorda]